MGEAGIAVIVLADVILFILALTFMREVVILRGEIVALSQLITTPPTPRLIGRVVPAALLERTAMALRQSGSHVVIFLSDTCGSCSDLVREVTPLVAGGELNAKHITCVVESRSAKTSVAAPLAMHGVEVVEDREGRIATECDVRGNPMLVSVNPQTGEATDYTYGGGARWILGHTSEGEPTPEPSRGRTQATVMQA